jgi:hypothetical protein
MDRELEKLEKTYENLDKSFIEHCVREVEELLWIHSVEDPLTIAELRRIEEFMRKTIMVMIMTGRRDLNNGLMMGYHIGQRIILMEKWAESLDAMNKYE